MNDFGMGTEKLEEYVRDNFPSASVVRMDVDTTSRKGAHERIINDFKSMKYNVLIGTQMIAKGLDFPNVTLVGIINADTSLNIPDFRANEKTFNLLYQTSGRAGRDKKPGDTRNHVCCYLEASNEQIKRCVEVRKLDLEDHDAFDKLRDSIKAGTYELWLNASNYTGFEEYTNGSFKINSIDSLRCNEAKILKLGKLIILAILFLI
jgi:excinuclease UvrABC helicase subunit UvrB